MKFSIVHSNETFQVQIGKNVSLNINKKKIGYLSVVCSFQPILKDMQLY